MQDHLVRREQFIKSLVSLCRKHRVMLDEPNWRVVFERSVDIENFIFREYCSTSPMSFIVDIGEVERVLREELWDEIHLKKKPEKINTTIYRVRELDCDGGVIGKTWSEEFYSDVELAKDRQRELIESSNTKNLQYPFDDVLNNVDGHSGYCNRQFGIMISIDDIVIEG